MAAMEEYRVQLETYSGPMDLLLYLIRREEVDVYDIPISRILEQYIGYVRLMEELDPDGVGDFLVLAATLMEIKSRLLLPTPPPEVDDGEMLDPRADLVRQLLAYRTFREAAGALRDRGDLWASRFGRSGIEMPDGEQEPDVDLEEVQVWDLLTAFNKLLASVGQRTVAHEVIYDDTPITLHAADILDRLEREGPTLLFEQIFEGRSRGEMIGLFLALLELIRQKRIRVQQDELHGQITVFLIDATPITGEFVQMPDEGHAVRGMPASEAGMAPDEDAEAFEEQEEGGAPEPLFEDEPDEDEEDDYGRRLDEIEVGDVDLGKTAEEPEEPPASAGAVPRMEPPS